jgi:hypothetical protein
MTVDRWAMTATFSRKSTPFISLNYQRSSIIELANLKGRKCQLFNNKVGTLLLRKSTLFRLFTTIGQRPTVIKLTNFKPSTENGTNK